MAKYRVTLDQQERRIVPDLKSSDRPNHSSENYWKNEAVVEGDEKVVAGALRAMADKIDPPKSFIRGE